MVGGLVLVVLAVVALIVALTSSSNSTGSGSALPTGLDLTTIHIVVPRTGQPSFSGTVGSMALTGTVSSGSSSGTQSLNGSLQVKAPSFSYKGDLAGTPYVLHVALDLANSSTLQNGQLTFDVTGTYGSERVNGSADFVVPTSSTTQSERVNFSGRIGTQEIGGTATATEEGSGAYIVTATVTVAP